MKISAISHKVGKEDSQEIHRKVAGALKFSDIVIGPDYALNCNPTKVSSSGYYNNLISMYTSLSTKYPNTLIIPGTILHPINDREMVCEAPVFLNGKLNRQLWKDSDNGEVGLATRAGFVYKRGSHENKQFEYKGKKIAVEICGDHGRQDVRGCDLEIILAYDKKAGLWLNASNDDFARKVVICDGYKPTIEAWDYNPERQPKQIEIKGEQKGDIFTFEV